MVYLGLDPGAMGAIAVYNPADPAASAVWDMPRDRKGKVDAPLVAALLRGLRLEYGKDVRAGVELVSSRPRQAGAFSFGLYTGILHGALAACGIPAVSVPPAVWKPSMGLGRGREETNTQTKDRARALAAQLFPSLAGKFARKGDDGRAEALLIAVYISSQEDR